MIKALIRPVYPFACAACLISGVMLDACFADDARAREEIFGSDLASNVLDVCRCAAQLPPAPRYEFLSKRVVADDRIRLGIDFTHLSPPPVAAETYQLDDLASRDDSDHDELLTETIGTGDVPVNGLWLLTHPGGAGRQVEVVWQRARICAEHLGRD